MNITAVRAMLTSKSTVEKLRQAIHNTNKLGWSCDHVRNRNGRNFLAVRVRDGKLEVTTRTGKDITQLIVKAAITASIVRN